MGNNVSFRAIIVLLFFFSANLAGEAQKWKYIGPDSAFQPNFMDFGASFVADRNHPAVFYIKVAGGNGNGAIYRTTNQGARWELCPLKDIIQMAIQPETSELFATTSERSQIILWKSKDFGRSFIQISEIPVTMFFLHPHDPLILFGFDFLNSALRRSVDGGRNWEQLTDQLPFAASYEFHFGDLVFSPFDSQTLYMTAAADNGEKFIPLFLASTNLGKSWTILEKATYSFHFDPLYANRVLAFNDKNLKSLDKAVGWIHKADTNMQFTSLIAFPHNKRRLLGLVLDLGSRSIVYESNNEGQTWHLKDMNLNGYLSSLVSVDDTFGTLLAGTEGGGIYRRDDSHDWKRASKGLHEAYVNSVAASNNALYVLFNFYFASMQKFGPWHIKSFSDVFPEEIVVNPLDQDNVYLAYYDGHDDDYFVGVSYDAGKNWSRIGQYTGISIDPVHPNILYLNQWTDLYKSNDGGKTAQALPIHPNSYQLLIDEHNDQILYMVRQHGLYKSNDGGQSMANVDPVGGHEHAISIGFLTRRNSLLAYTSQGGIYRTHDGGASWNRLATIICKPLHDCYDSQISAADENHYFLIMKGKLFESLDAGRSWNDRTDAVGENTRVNGMTDPRVFPFYLATSRGLYESQ